MLAQACQTAALHGQNLEPVSLLQAFRPAQLCAVPHPYDIVLRRIGCC